MLCGSAGATEWNFDVTLDGKPIGTHRFSVTAQGDGAQVRSEADYRVKVLGMTLYRYRHRAEETWSRGCLARLDATTDDNGQVTRVEGGPAGDDLRWEVRTGGGPTTQSSRGCTWSFAYWNPGLAGRRSLLDPGTGRLVAVDVRPLAAAAIEVHGRPTEAQGWRIAGPEQPIDVWYADGRWVGLDATVAGQRRLSYRLP
jgi:hypothetical protein